MQVQYALPQCSDLASHPYLHQHLHSTKIIVTNVAVLHKPPVEYVTGEIYFLLHSLPAIYHTGKWRRAMRPLWFLYTSKRFVFILCLSISSSSVVGHLEIRKPTCFFRKSPRLSHPAPCLIPNHSISVQPWLGSQCSSISKDEDTITETHSSRAPNFI